MGYTSQQQRYVGIAQLENSKFCGLENAANVAQRRKMRLKCQSLAMRWPTNTANATLQLDAIPEIEILPMKPNEYKRHARKDLGKTYLGELSMKKFRHRKRYMGMDWMEWLAFLSMAIANLATARVHFSHSMFS